MRSTYQNGQPKWRQLLECASPLALFEASEAQGRQKSARGLAHSKTLARLFESFLLLTLTCIAQRAVIIRSSAAEGPCSIQLHDVTKETGITFVHTDGSSGNRYIVETVASGLALFDYNNDGKVDIYFLNGAPLKAARRNATTIGGSKIAPESAT